MNDLISVIIPAYNAEKFLDACLKSITSQTYSSIEIIVINDGSTDSTGEIADEWSRKDNRVLVIHQTNRGVSFARNVGLDAAKGDFIGFVDADDEVELDMYEFLLHNIKKYDADISHCGFELVKLNESIQFHNTGVVLIQNQTEALKDLLSGERIEPSICNKLYKKSILRDIRFKIDVRINEDLIFNVEAFNKTVKSIYEDVIKYKYKYNSLSASRSSESLFIGGEIYKAARIVRTLLQGDEIKRAAEKFYIAKLLSILQLLKKNNFYNSKLAESIRFELKNHVTLNLGLRLLFLKWLLVRIPKAYSPVKSIYNLFFAKNQKWN